MKPPNGLLRELVHRGTVFVSALFFDVGLLGETETRRRVLSLWQPGCRAYDVEGGLLLRLAAPESIDTRRSLGTPLVAHGRMLLAAPFDAAIERTSTEAGEAAFLVRNGRPVELPLADARLVDPSEWLDLVEWQELPVRPLGRLAVEPLREVPPVELNVRSALGDLPPAAEEMYETMRALRAARAGAEQTEARGIQNYALIDWLVGRLAAVTAWFQRLRDQNPSGSGRKHAGGGRSVARGTAAPASNRLPKAHNWWGRMLTNFLIKSRLARLIGRKHAEYVARMMELFERGDILEALRYAIPLGGAGGEPQLSLRSPTPRSDLSINTARRGSTSAILGTANVLDTIEQLYRKTFERLDEEGKIDQAAFVLAELLWRSEEAVAYLERHGRLKLAAELAESRELPPGLVVRQWFLAGDRERAVLIARTKGAFSDAILRLEKTNIDQAQMLRLLWADHLAESGDFAGAVEAIWPVPGARTIALKWIDLCIEGGGVVEARMLPRKLALAPESFEQVRDRALALLEDDGPDAPMRRRVFSEVLVVSDKSPGFVPIARAACRAVLRDVGHGWGQPIRGHLNRLLKVAGDGSLRADLPALPQPNEQGEVVSSIQLPVEAADTGTLPIYDAVAFENGRLLVALGEAGVRLVNRNGAVITHWDQPAHALIASDHLNRVITVARRGQNFRLARIDLITRKGTPWFDLEGGIFANTYDGSTWILCSGNHLVALDATCDMPRILWRRPNIGRSVVSIGRDVGHFALVTREWKMEDVWGNFVEPTVKWESWRYTTPGYVLQHQTEVPTPRPQEGRELFLTRSVNTDGCVWDLAVKVPIQPTAPQDPSPSWTVYASGWGLTTIPLRLASRGDAGSIHSKGVWCAALIQSEDGTECHLIHQRLKMEVGTVVLRGSGKASAKIQNDRLILSDDRGRLIVIDLQSGQTTTNIRIT